MPRAKKIAKDEDPLRLSSRFLLTWFNFSEDSLETLNNHKDIKFIIYQAEICPSTGNRHLQMYIEIKTRQKISYILNLFQELPNMIVNPDAKKEGKKKKLIYCGPKVKIAEADCVINSYYCSKKDSHDDKNKLNYCNDVTYIPDTTFYWHRFNDLPEIQKYHKLWLKQQQPKKPGKQGERTDLVPIMNDIKEGKSELYIMEKYPSIYQRYNKLVTKMLLMRMPHRTQPPNITIRFGLSRTGKTMSFCDIPEEDKYMVSMAPGNQTTWFDGYSQQKYVIFDEFTPDSIPIQQMLKYLDRVGMLVPFKGGFTQFNSPNIIITTNYSPLDFYPKANPENLLAFYARIAETGKVYYHHTFGAEPDDYTPYIKDIVQKYLKAPDQAEKARKTQMNRFKNYKIHGLDRDIESDDEFTAKDDDLDRIINNDEPIDFFNR